MTDTNQQSEIVQAEAHINKLELSARVLSIFNWFGGPDPQLLFWRTDDKFAPITFMVNCSDLFIWACDDVIDITSENIDSLEATIKEVELIDEDIVDQAPLLWCCRQRGNQPQKPYYKHLNKSLHDLFEACGPVVGSNITA